MKFTLVMSVAAKYTEGALNGLEGLANEIMSLSQSRCPVDTGMLRGSAQVTRKEKTVLVSYGGAAASYAVQQHENLQYHHDVGQAKFLESSFDELKDKAPDYVKRAIR